MDGVKGKGIVNCQKTHRKVLTEYLMFLFCTSVIHTKGFTLVRCGKRNFDKPTSSHRQYRKVRPRTSSRSKSFGDES